MHMVRDIDRVITELRTAYPLLVVEQLRVAHPGADDDGLWFFRHPERPGEVQLESSTGASPFLLEGDDGTPPVSVRSVEEAVALVAFRLGLAGRTA